MNHHRALSFPEVIPGCLLSNLPFAKVLLGMTPTAWLGTLILGATHLRDFGEKGWTSSSCTIATFKTFLRAASIGNAAVERSAGELQERV